MTKVVLDMDFVCLTGGAEGNKFEGSLILIYHIRLALLTASGATQLEEESR